MDGWRDGFSLHSTELCPLLGPLLCHPFRPHNIKEAGQGNRLPHDACRQIKKMVCLLLRSFTAHKIGPLGATGKGSLQEIIPSPFSAFSLVTPSSNR